MDVAVMKTEPGQTMAPIPEPDGPGETALLAAVWLTGAEEARLTAQAAAFGKPLHHWLNYWVHHQLTTLLELQPNQLRAALAEMRGKLFPGWQPPDPRDRT